MNNLKQKNIMYGRDAKDVLPHRGKGDSVVLSQNSNITDARVNNAITQLINNDLYLENKMRLGLNYQPGPDRDGIGVSSLADGSKVWADSDDYTQPLRISRKVETPLSASIYAIRRSPASFIVPINNTVFVGFDDGLMYETALGFAYCTDLSGNTIHAVNYYNGLDGIFFVSTSGVYELVQRFNDNYDGISYALSGIESGTDFENLSCVAYDSSDSMLYVGGDNFIARGQYKSGQASVNFVSDVKFSANETYSRENQIDEAAEYLTDMSVNGFQVLDRNDQSVNEDGRKTNILAATDKGLFRSDTRKFLIVDSKLKGKKCISIVNCGNIVYALTDDGYVYRQVKLGADFEKYSEQPFVNPIKLAEYSADLYVICRRKIYKYTSYQDTPAVDVVLNVGYDIVDFASTTLYGHLLMFTVCDDTIRYYSDFVNNGEYRITNGSSSVSISQIVVQPRKNASGVFDIYVLARTDDKNVIFAVRLQFDADPVYDYSFIDGMNSIATQCDAIVYGADHCYYAKDGAVYNADTGGFCRIGDVSISQMDYLSSDNSIIVAAGEILYLLDASSLTVKDQYYGSDDMRIKYVSRSQDIAYFASTSSLMAVQITEDGFGDAVEIAHTAEDQQLAGIAAANGKVFTFSVGHLLSSASGYYVRNAVASQGAGDPDETDASDMLFPVMPHMEETSVSAALGLSAGHAYKLIYDSSNGDPSENCHGIVFPKIPIGDSISAFCKVGMRFFVSAGGKTYQYEYGFGEFDLDSLDDEMYICSADIAASRLVYSGTDSFFDMRIYAQTASGPKVYQPQIEARQKLTHSSSFDDFIMYIDAVGDDEDEYYAVVAGINVSTAKLLVNAVQIVSDEAVWPNSWYEYQLADITAGSNVHSQRSPYALFYTGNSRVYVAYTALSSDNATRIDCIAALQTDSLLGGKTNPSLITSDDFDIVGVIDSSGTGRIRFSGFSVDSTADEDTDVIVTHSRDQQNKDYIVTYRVQASGSSRLQNVKNKYQVQSSPLYAFFQPDCIKIENKYYILLAAKTDSDTVQTQLFEYDTVRNECSDLSKYSTIYGVPDFSDIFVSGSPDGSIDTLRLIAIDVSGRAYAIDITSGQSTLWDEAEEIKGGIQFKNVSRFSLNQLIGYTDDFVYDFQTGVTYDISDIASRSVHSVYATDNGDSRDYMLVDNNGSIYSVEPTGSMTFEPVYADGSELTGSSMILCKTDPDMFIIDCGDQSGAGPYSVKVYIETDSCFSLYAEAELDGSPVVDAMVCRKENSYYLCIRHAESGSVDVYSMENGGMVFSTIFNDVFYENTENIFNGYISYIAYDSVGSEFSEYVRNELFGQDLKDYCWIFAAEPNNNGRYKYFNFNSDSDLEFTRLTPMLGSDGCIRLGVSEGIAYGTYLTLDGTVIRHLVEAGSEPVTYNGESFDGWLAGGKYFFNKASSGLAYYNGSTWSDIGDGIYLDIVGKTGGRCYFLRRDNPTERDLYEGFSNARYPLIGDPKQYTVSGVDDNPIKLASGRVYAGYIGKDEDLGVCSLFALGPMLDMVVQPTANPSSGGGLADPEYFVTVFKTIFDGFSDGDEDNITQIVALGDFLDELIVLGGKHLYAIRVQDKLFLDETRQYSKVSVFEALPYTELTTKLQDGASASAKRGNARYIALDGKQDIYVFSDPQTGIIMKSLNRQMLADGVNARSFYEIGQNKFLVATNSGVYRYMHIDGIPVVGRISQQYGYDIAQITSYNFSGVQDTYVLANALDNALYTSENGRVWRLNFRPASGRFNSVYPQNAHEWYFGTSDGLFKSKYEYKMVDDLQKFTESDLYSLYTNLMASDISDMCQDMLEDHEISPDYKYGHSTSSLVSEINQTLLSVNFDGLQSSGWQRSEENASTYQVSNDIVFEQFWGDNSDWNLSLSVENHLTSQTNAKFTYLFRRWMSGMTELYVHIPTTNTYYINHVPSTPNYNINEVTTELTAANVSQFGRDKQVFSHDPNNSYTRIKLSLSRSIFNIDMLLNVQACGNSLPLKIYRETIQENGTNVDYEAAQYFNSYIAPTVMTALSADDDNYTLEFACFGTDEQAVRISFMDNVNKFDQEYYRIVFNPNGLESDQSQFVKQRIRADGLPYKLRRNQYKWPQDQKLFAGWTFTPYPKDDQTTNLDGFYQDAQEITSGEIEEQVGPIRSGQDVVLYAVWITYQFNDEDTTLMLAPNPESMRFKISSVDTVDGYTIGDRVVVKFEEVDS